MANAPRRRSRRAKPLSHLPGTLTRERLLDAAEELFADNGFSGVSLREIVNKAAVNVAAAHYHFGSKERLFEQVFSRAAQPVKEQTVKMLAEAQVNVGRPQYLEQVIRAIVVPNFTAGSDVGKPNANYSKLRAYLFLEDRAFAHKLFKTFYAQISQSTIGVLHRALPHLDTTEIAWRFHVLLGTIVFTTIPAGRVHPFTRQDYRPEDAQEAIRYLVPLLVSVFRAPSIGAESRPSRKTRAAAAPMRPSRTANA
jgi:AcrR family transcriptional regulator